MVNFRFKLEPQLKNYESYWEVLFIFVRNWAYLSLLRKCRENEGALERVIFLHFLRNWTQIDGLELMILGLVFPQNVPPFSWKQNTEKELEKKDKK